MKTFNFTVLKDGIKTKMSISSRIAHTLITQKDGNKLGLRERTKNWDVLERLNIIFKGESAS